MELKWKKPIAEAETVADIVGVTKEQFDAHIEKFQEKVHKGEIKNNGELMEYAGKIATTTEEAVVFASVFTSVISRRRNPIEEMIEAAMAGKGGDDDEEDE